MSNDTEQSKAARKSLLAKMQHTTDVCHASRNETGPLSEARLAEIRENDARTCGTDNGFFNGYSMTHVDRHDLLRHIDALATSAPAAPETPGRATDACVVCGCTPGQPCEGDCVPAETSLEASLCSLCAWAIARDAVAAGIYTLVPSGTLF